MSTRHRFRNGKYRLEIRERDHGPAHCHLVGGSVDVIIELESLESDGQWPRGLKVEVMAWIEAHQEELWMEWRKWHR